jgi:hypothetical protein
MRIIQISGKGRVGKTSVAKIIEALAYHKGYIPVIVPFADSLKKAAADLGYSKETKPDEYRKFCQELGASKRKENPEYWIEKTFETIQEYMLKEVDNKAENKKYWEYVIIQDDVRYMNEIALGRELAATQIFIDSGGRTLSEENAEWRNHESEKLANDVEDSFGLPNSEYEELFDLIIVNNETLMELKEDINESIDEILDTGKLEIEELPWTKEDEDE